MKTEWSWYEGWLPAGDVISFDVENDFYFLKKIKSKAETTITQCAVSNGITTVVARDAFDLANMFHGLMAAHRNGRTLVAHNGWYADVPWIRRTCPDFPFNQGETMALGYLADENQPLSLKALCMKYLPDVEDWKEGIHAEQGSDAFAEYNATDAVLTMRLYNALTSLLGKRAELVPKIIMPAMLALRACSTRGIYLDKRAIGEADEFYSTKISVVLATLRDEFGISSPRKRQVVGEALTSAGHTLGHTETGKLSTGKATLARLKETPLVVALKEFWKLDKAYSAYVKRYKKLSESGDGRSHSEYTVVRTVTGRTSNSDQQLPRTPLLHAFFSAPAGFRLVSADYSAVEFRVAAWVAGEQGIIERYRQNPGFDPHTWFAAMLYGKPEGEITKDERQIAKSANFGLLYMAQPPTLVEYVRKTTGRELSIVEATRIYKMWHSELPAFKPWYGRTWDFLVEHGYVESVTGRRRHFVGGELNASLQSFERQKPVLKQLRWMRAAALREGVNFQVQSLAADIALIALRKCQLEGLPVNGFVHDSISLELEEGVDLTEKLEKYMVRYPVWYLKKHFGVDFNMPLEIQVK